MPDKPAGRIASYRESLATAAPSLGDGPIISTGAVFKYVADITGPTMELPKRFDPRGGFIVSVQDKRTYETVFAGYSMEDKTITWSFAEPPLHWDAYRAVIMW